jgi:hypothetical protein
LQLGTRKCARHLRNPLPVSGGRPPGKTEFNLAKSMNPQELLGRTVTNVFETEPTIIQDGIPGPASYFDIVLELDGSDLYELGAHQISKWTKHTTLIPVIQNDLGVLGKRITKVIQKDSEEYYDGSLTLLLENNISLEHQTTNGDQLHIDNFKGET